MNYKALITYVTQTLITHYYILVKFKSNVKFKILKYLVKIHNRIINIQSNYMYNKIKV